MGKKGQQKFRLPFSFYVPVNTKTTKRINGLYFSYQAFVMGFLNK